MTKDAKNLIVGLDIGTSKVVAVVAEVMSDGRHEVIGLGQHESKGLKKGVVVNIEATVESIQRALEEAELMAVSAPSIRAAWSRSRTRRSPRPTSRA
jgi:cell division protein FtsA